MFEKYYQVLELQKNASDEEVKNAYKQIKINICLLLLKVILDVVL